jgi:hypothetical protein
MNSVFIGFDSRQPEAFAVCRHSLHRHLNLAGNPLMLNTRTYCLELGALRAAGLYWRPTTVRASDGQLWDDISGAPMSTEFAITRFLVPHLTGRAGWALFHDCDMLWRTDPRRLFALADPQYAVQVVKHEYDPPAGVKMDGQAQTRYQRKNWSSVMLFNCAHPSNARLDLDMVNSRPGRELHAFCWLKDEEIGTLGTEWNWLPGHSDPTADPDLIHWTEGGPWLDGYQNVPYASEWRAERHLWLNS